MFEGYKVIYSIEDDKFLAIDNETEVFFYIFVDLIELERIMF